MPTKEEILQELDRLAEAGLSLAISLAQLTSPEPSRYFYRQYSEWKTRCVNLLRVIGIAEMRDVFLKSDASLESVNTLLGIVRGMRDIVSKDMVARLEAVTLTDVLNRLLTLAEDHLLEGRFRAAGAVGLAVLDEHLRQWCGRVHCTYTNHSGFRFTTADHNRALHSGGYYDEATMKRVDAMATVGADAAHEVPTLQPHDVTKFLADLRDFRNDHPLP